MAAAMAAVITMGFIGSVLSGRPRFSGPGLEA